MKKTWHQAYSSARRFLRHPRSIKHEHWALQDNLLDVIAKFPNSTFVWNTAIKSPT